jgi:hypothetical protein
MSLASEILTWQHENRLYSRVTTNGNSNRLLTRLGALDLLELAETVHAFFGDRRDGGAGYEVLWKKHVRIDDLRSLIHL